MARKSEQALEKGFAYHTIEKGKKLKEKGL